MKKILSTIVTLAGISGLIGGCGNVEDHYQGRYNIDGKNVYFSATFLFGKNIMKIYDDKNIITYTDLEDNDGDSITVDEVSIMSGSEITNYSRDNKKDKENMEIAQKQFDDYLSKIQEIRMKKIQDFEINR